MMVINSQYGLLFLVCIWGCYALWRKGRHIGDPRTGKGEAAVCAEYAISRKNWRRCLDNGVKDGA